MNDEPMWNTRGELVNLGQYNENVEGDAVFNAYYRKMLDSHSLEPAYVEHLKRYYVAPIDESAILDRLIRCHMVVIAGARGIGRLTTAVCTLATLHEHAEPASEPVAPLRLVEVRRGINDTFDVSGIVIESGIGYLLDVRADDEQVTPALGRSLYNLSEHLRKAGSYLVVTASSRLWSTVGAGAESLLVALKGPKPQDVFRAHLTEKTKAEFWLSQPGVDLALADASAEYAARVAGFVNSAEEIYAHAAPSRTSDDGNPEVALVLAALTHWRSELLEWYRRQHGAHAHSFLIVSAVLHGFPADVTYRLALDLAATLDSQPVAAGLSEPGVIQLVDEVEAWIDSGDRITFRRPGFPSAVIDFFQRNRPDLAPRFREWLVRLPGIIAMDSGLSGETKSAISGRIFELLAEIITARHDLLLLKKVVDTWAPDPDLISAGADIVTVCALDPSFGRAVRAATLDWASNSSRTSSSIARARMVAVACGRDFRKIGPAIVLKRLEHLSAHEDERIRNTVASAVRDLIRSPDFRKILAREPYVWESRGNFEPGAIARILVSALSSLADDGSLAVLSLARDDRDLRWLPSAWSTVLTNVTDINAIAELLSAWVGYLQRRPDWTDHVYQVLAAAVNADNPGRDTRLAHLVQSLYRDVTPGKDQAADAIREALVSTACAPSDLPPSLMATVPAETAAQA